MCLMCCLHSKDHRENLPDYFTAIPRSVITDTIKVNKVKPELKKQYIASLKKTSEMLSKKNLVEEDDEIDDLDDEMGLKVLVGIHNYNINENPQVCII